jgi:hypothetical protein
MGCVLVRRDFRSLAGDRADLLVPDVLITGGGTAGDGLMGQLTRLLPGVDLNALVKKQAVALEAKI